MIKMNTNKTIIVTGGAGFISSELIRYLITFVQDRPGHDERYAIDNTKIKTNLGWTQKENFKSGMQKTVEWYLCNLSWSENIQNGSYKLERLGVKL